MSSLESMAVLVILVLTGLISVTGAEEPKVGTCAMEDYANDNMNCEVEFVKKLKNNKKANCSEAFNGMVDCVVAIALKCYKDQIKDPRVMNMTMESIRKATEGVSDAYCVKGAFKFPDSLKNTTAMDDICGSNFFTKAEECGKKFMKQFKDDWTSSEMCRLYAEANQCTKNLVYNCKLDEKVMEQLKKTYNRHYNPWCSSGKDPKEFIGGNAAGTISSYKTLLVAAAVGSYAVLMSV